MIWTCSATLLIALAVTISPVFSQTQPTNATPPQPPPTPGILGRPSPPQPLQRQGVDYFVGTWSFKWTGRESPVNAGPRTGSVTFARLGDTAFLERRTEGKVDGGAAYKESATLGWNDAHKVMAMHEKVASGAEILSVGDWSSPIAIRFESAPVKVGAQTVRVKRTFNIISATSFTVAEELSLDNGPYVRLGTGVYTKAVATR